MKRLTYVALGMALCLSGIQAATISYTTSFLTDGNQSASAGALFTFTTDGQLTVTLTDTTQNPASDAPNLADLAFKINGLNSGAAVSASGNTVTNIQNNTAGTAGSYSGASPWTLTWGNNWGNTNAFDLYATGASSANHNTAAYSIVGAPSGNGTYTGVFPAGTSKGSANLLSSGNDGVMFDQSASFVLSIPGLNATNFVTLGSVAFGFGPDGQNKPDGDDISAGVFVNYCLTCGPGGGGSPVPEPSSMGLIGLGLSGIGLLGRKFMAR